MYGGELTTPVEAEIKLDTHLVINRFNSTNIETLKRYIAGNSRWEIRKEQKYDGSKNSYDEIVYSIRREERNGKYETTLNGYYDDFGGNSDIYQTRVIISFGKPHGHGNDTTHVTYAYLGDKTIKTIIESEEPGVPGNSSYIILHGSCMNIEIYEQAKKLDRKFTIQTLYALDKELTMVLENLQQIEQTGFAPVPEFYPVGIDSNYINIEDGMQPGIYVVKAGLSLTEKGEVFVKVFKSKTNQRLSPGEISPRTTRTIGWSKDGSKVFLYESDLTVYEGDWDHTYKARFEIWFRSEKGSEKKLAEKERMINGWER